MPSKRRTNHYFILILTFASVKVLNASIDQQKSISSGSQWYEKSWRPTTSANDKTQSKVDADGSGAGEHGDLDENSPGIGEDDEDSENNGGSGDDSNSRFDVGSGDIQLPPAPQYPFPASVSPPESTGSTPVRVSIETKSTPTTAFDIATRPEIDTTPLYAVHVVTDRHLTTPETTTTSTATLPRVTSTATTPKKTTSRTVPSTTLSAPKKETTTTKYDDRNKPLPASFWMRPGVLAGLIGGAIAGLLAAILLVMFVVYRMRKKDEGSYALDEPKSPPTYAYAYQKAPTREVYA